MKYAILCAVICLSLSCTSNKATIPAAPAALTNEQLIDRLMLVGNDEFSVRTNIIGMGADGQGEIPKGLLKLQDPEPKPGDAMQELVRRGPAAMPALLAHLDDPRKTQARVEGFISFRYVPHYDRNWRGKIVSVEGIFFDWDPGFADKESIRPRATTRPGDGGVSDDDDGYTMAVGDICFELIGQITNRDFKPSKYIPSGNIRVSPPVVFPSLAAAVRKEWSGLTPARHRESLIADVTMPDNSSRAVNGVRLLTTYYSDVVPHAVKRRLALPEYHSEAVNDFVRNVYFSYDLPEAKRRVREFAGRSPGERDGLIEALWQDRNHEVGYKLTETIRIENSPRVLLGELVPKIDETIPPRLSGVDANDTLVFLGALTSIQTPGLLVVLRHELKIRADIHSTGMTDGDQFVRTFIVHFATASQRDDLLKICNRRQSELKDPEDQKSYQESIERLNTLKL